MAKLSSKREKGRAWTSNTFLPESGSHSTNLDAISENDDAMDEDLDDDNPVQVHLGASAPRLTTSMDDDSSSNGSSGSGGNSSDDQDDNDDNDDDDSGRRSANHNGDRDDDDDGDDDDDDDAEKDPSQDQGASDDSDDDIEMTTNETNGNGQEHSSGRMDIPRRSRTGLAPKKKRTSIGSLSTSPSNPSKIVSATPSRKITKKSKTSVKPKTSKGCLSSSAARQATEEAKLDAAKPIVSRFLELENTKLNDKLLQLFMIPGMIPYVIESITRLDPELTKSFSPGADDDDSSQESKFMTHVDQCRRMRDFSDLNLMKRSYTAMNFLTRSDVYNEFILSSSHQAIVRDLFKIFRPESNGNFYHFQKVFETILRKFRAQTMATLFEDSDAETGLSKTPLIFDMLPFLDQPPVALSLIRVLFQTYTYGFTERLPDYYKSLQHGHFLEMLLAMVTLVKEPSPNMADFVVSLLDEATRSKEAKIIFSCLADDPIWAERLAQGVQSESLAKRNGCIEIIYSVLVRRVSLSGYVVPSSFTVARLWLLDSIYHCLSDVKDDPAPLESIPETFWTTLVDSFFQFPFNNAFHVHFYKLVRVVLYAERAAVYDRFFVKTDLIKRLINHYMTVEQPTGSRGYIILILNCIRLSIELEARRAAEEMEGGELPHKGNISTTFWTDLTRAISEWEGFQTTLRAATLEQTRDTLCDMDPNLRFQFAPLQSRHPTETPLTKRHTGIPGVSARGNDGIDLGSQYGNSLGFGVPMKYDRAAEEQAKEKAKEQLQKNSELEVQKALANLMPNIDWKLIPPKRVLNAMLGINQGKDGAGNQEQSANGHSSSAATASGTADEPGSAAKDGTTATTTTKSKKKKKNKKKRQISSVHAGEASDEDHHHSEDAESSTRSGTSSENHDDEDDDEDDDHEHGSDPGLDAHHGELGSEGLTEEERLERKRQKKKEKRRKAKLNKRNRTNPVAEQQHSQRGGNDSASNSDDDAMEL
ncbi:hypothetical protein BGZ99_008497 [Dissophora globulifera]|uniref:Uncharacterized protein n=1 Tax=Dissophora globulifera TaxID=979702 RepID=A0A9P6RB70_9FUNG|nr:hypothetical protein BGZ99_008497 [Dissophora globulifera]